MAGNALTQFVNPIWTPKTMLEHATEKSLEFRLIKDFQRNFPLCAAPFAELAARLGVAEGTVLQRLEQMRRERRIARVGAVFAPKRIGASTLAAMAVPAEKLALVADTINRFPEVNQNYERDHAFNLWFVATAGSEGRLQAALGAIEQAAGFPLLPLPLLREFRPEAASVSMAMSSLDEIGRRLVMALQEGLPLFIRPFSVLASRVGCDEAEVIVRIRRWCEEGVIKRFGLVLRQPPEEEAGAAGAVLVLDVPDAAVDTVGERLSADAVVTACVQRTRALPDWPYNLFCKIKGATRDEVLKTIEALRERLDLSGYACDILFSQARP